MTPTETPATTTAGPQISVAAAQVFARTKLTNAELARLTGYTEAAFSRWRRGQRGMSQTAVKKIMAALERKRR